jgi:hypothetical protein
MVAAAGPPVDRYIILEYLSEGGMGAIYLGKKMGAGGFEREVVLKQLLPEFTQHEEFIDLFLREARLSATLDHANIIHTIDLVTAGSEYFIVMEYLAGADLRSLLKRARRRGKRFSPAAGIFVVREVLSALAYAHSKRDTSGRALRLIHRDVSPSNLLVSITGEVKLTDFGIAKAATHNSVFYRVKGKIGYMSPEQAKSAPLDHRSDLYSLAVCLYEIIAGERLFVHAGLTTPPDEIYSQPVPLLSRKVPGLPPDLDVLMQRALSMDAAARFQTAGEFQDALARCAHRNGLLMSAPELAAELREVCGSPATWREEDSAEAPGTAAIGRGNTELYTDEGEDDDVIASTAAAGGRMASVAAGEDLRRLKSVELTSMLIQLAGSDGTGAHPLVDLSQLGAARVPEPTPGLTPEPEPEPRPQPQTPARMVPSDLDSGVVVVPPAAGSAERARDRGKPSTHNIGRRRGPHPLLIVVGLLLIAAAIAVVIGMSGPGVG